LDVFCSNGIIKIKSLQFPGKKPIDSNDLFNAKRDIISPREMLA
jgi:methionyl-tRNA formyltransferase